MSGDYNMSVDWSSIFDPSVSYDDSGERTGRISITLEEYSSNSPITLIKEFTDDNNTWPSLLAVFIRALEAQYGYNIMDRIFIRENGFNEGLRGWPGGVVPQDY